MTRRGTEKTLVDHVQKLHVDTDLDYEALAEELDGALKYVALMLQAKASRKSIVDYINRHVDPD